MKTYGAGLALALLAGGPALAEGIQILPAEQPTSNPWWTCDGEPPARYYPPVAMRQRVEGFAMTQCRLDEKYRPTACTWQLEDKPGFVFGATAAKLACMMKLRAPPNAKAPPGTVALIPIRFKLPPK